jgi:hypothetical protein
MQEGNGLDCCAGARLKAVVDRMANFTAVLATFMQVKQPRMMPALYSCVCCCVRCLVLQMHPR